MEKFDAIPKPAMVVSDESLDLSPDAEASSEVDDELQFITNQLELVDEKIADIDPRVHRGGSNAVVRQVTLSPEDSQRIDAETTGWKAMREDLHQELEGYYSTRTNQLEKEVKDEVESVLRKILPDALKGGGREMLILTSKGDVDVHPQILSGLNTDVLSKLSRKKIDIMHRLYDSSMAKEEFIVLLMNPIKDKILKTQKNDGVISSQETVVSGDSTEELDVSAEKFLEQSYDLTIGPDKPMGYVVVDNQTQVELFNVVAQRLESNGNRAVIIGPSDSHFYFPVLFTWNEQHLQKLIDSNANTISDAGWPNTPEAFVRRVASETVESPSELFDLVADAFGDTKNPGRTNTTSNQPRYTKIESADTSNLTGQEKEFADFLRTGRTIEARIADLDIQVKEGGVTNEERIYQTNKIVQEYQTQWRRFNELLGEDIAAGIENGVIEEQALNDTVDSTEKSFGENEVTFKSYEKPSEEYLEVSSDNFNEIGRNLLPGMETDVAEAVIKKAFTKIEDSLSVLDSEVVDICEQRVLAMQNENYDLDEYRVPENIFVSYMSLRAGGFSSEEVRELIEASIDGTMEAIMLERVQKERLVNAELLTQSAEQISLVETGILNLFEQLEVDYPADETKVVVLGKYQGMLIQVATEGTLGGFDAGGRYLAEGGVLFLRDTPKYQNQKGQLNEQGIHLLAHERLHSLSTIHLPETTKGILTAEDTEGFQVGFSKVLEGDNSPSYEAFNEGVTELFARRISSDFEFTEVTAGYDEEVDSIKYLLSYIGDADYTEKELLAHYTSADGFSNLSTKVEAMVGPNGLALCNAMFRRPDTLKKFLLCCKNQAEDINVNRLELDVEVLQNASPALNPSLVSRDYPFLKLMTHIRNSNTSEWERVEFNESS